ncbi:MAG TPA: hypothetical protein VLT61_01235 [Anaeromyxobacteraceae bacterium]|nr:hypothetical protein [Anaeromyxobacteraceae bacterium]
MSEGEHTIIGKIPRERLNQIATRKLTALGIQVRLGADRESLEGELAFTRVAHPATGQPIPRARFAVSGHDHLRFVDPPLASLGPVNFYNHEKLATLEQAVAAALQQRAAALQDVALKMRLAHLDAQVDADRVAVRAVLKTATHAFEIIGAPDGIRVTRVAPVGGAPYEVAGDFPPLVLSQFPTPTDLEVYLVGNVNQMRPAAAVAAARPLRAGPPPAGGQAGLVATPAPRTALTLAAVAQVFGADSILAPNAMIELIQEFEYAGTRYRFVATREMGTRFKGRVIGPNGDVWADKFELANFPGTRKVVAAALGANVHAPVSTVDVSQDFGGEPASIGSVEVPHHMMPAPGETWVMNVLIEQMSSEEVRYVVVDIDGRPYGAARVLKRPDFEAVFSQEKGGWRLLIHIDQVADGNVLYRQLDRQRQPMGAPKKLAAAILVANFVPEAAAY